MLFFSTPSITIVSTSVGGGHTLGDDVKTDPSEVMDGGIDHQRKHDPHPTSVTGA